MKTGIKGLLAILLGLFMFSSVFSSTETKAPQCPKLENMTQCVVKVNIYFYKKDAAGNCTTNPCGIASISLLPGQTILITPPAGCDCGCVSVSVQALNGMPIAPATVDNFGSGGPVFFPSNPCAAAGIKYDASNLAFVVF